MRYEQKFVFENDEYPLIVNSILSSKALFTEFYQKRQVNNIYLDSADYENYFANINGDQFRTKHRIRWYGETTCPEEAVLEYKIKNGMLGTKKHYKLPGFCLDNKFRYSEYLAGVARAVKEKDRESYYQMLSDISNLLPSLYNTYSRRYFVSFDEKYRITIDTDMKFNKIGEVYYGMQEKYIDDVVVELKYNNKYAVGASDIIQELGFRVSKNSKYVNGVGEYE